MKTIRSASATAMLALVVAVAAMATAFAQGPLLFTAQSIVYRAVDPPLARMADDIYAATMRAIGAEA